MWFMYYAHCVPFNTFARTTLSTVLSSVVWRRRHHRRHGVVEAICKMPSNDKIMAQTIWCLLIEMI